MSGEVMSTDLANNALALLERCRRDETALERELDAAQIRLEVVREVIAALTGRRRAQRASGGRGRLAAVEGAGQPEATPEVAPEPPAAA